MLNVAGHIEPKNELLSLLPSSGLNTPLLSILMKREGKKSLWMPSREYGIDIPTALYVSPINLILITGPCLVNRRNMQGFTKSDMHACIYTFA